MFIVECIIINPFTNLPYVPCGSDYTFIIHDLKTINGVINRIKKIYYLRKDIISLQISKGDIYNNIKVHTVTNLSDFKFMAF
jgi:hypothetical protein